MLAVLEYSRGFLIQTLPRLATLYPAHQQAHRSFFLDSAYEFLWRPSPYAASEIEF